MMGKFFFIEFIFLLTCSLGIAQFDFPQNGHIIFERKINYHAIFPLFVAEADISVKAEINSDFQNYIANNPQFRNDSFQLSFENDKTFYEPLISSLKIGIGTPVANRNKVYTDFTIRTVIAEKNTYDEIIVLKDSIRNIKWKLTDETREIAGYDCRRANALIMDSVYVVAFYTDAIKTKGGPELFNGLPGMILGVVLPHYHISYFATKIDLSSTSMIQYDFNGKTVSQQQYQNSVINYLNESQRYNSWIKIFIGL